MKQNKGLGVILCFETATTNCSVALGKDGKLLALKEDNSKGYSHAELLHVYTDQILKENGYAPQDLTAVAVSKGPGSYTGLRIGVSAAKGLCYSLDIPLISVPTLESLARQVRPEDGDFIVPLLDARRMEVYAAGFSSTLETVFKTRAEILDEQSYHAYLEQGVVSFVGNGVEKFEAICKHRNARFMNRLPSAVEMIPLAVEKHRLRQYEDVAYFEPYYLKDFMPG